MAETPPAMTRDFVSGFCLIAVVIFSRRISVTAWSKEAARSALVVSSSKSASLEEG